VENITVQHIHPEPETLMYSVVEDYDGITKILTVNVEAEVTFEGYMHKSDYWGRTEEDEAADGIRVVDPDLNDHDVLVCFDRPVSFTYGAIVMTTGSTVEDLQFNEATVGNP